MYEGSFGGKKQPTSEEYLLGKKFEDKEASDVKQVLLFPFVFSLAPPSLYSRALVT